MHTPRPAHDIRSSWSFEPAPTRPEEPASLRVLYLESYGAGSHLRIARLLQRHSQHRVDLIFAGREHWRWLALTVHRAFTAAINAVGIGCPDVVVCSGPADARLVASALPRAWGGPPIAAYFHESQWTYPDPALDPRPYAVAHLGALEAADEVWFNSRYHRDVFREAALSNPSWRVRRLARDVIPEHWHKARVLYPPVHVDPRPREAQHGTFTVAWAARWEREKRPDLFVDALLECLHAGLDFKVHLLGIPARIEDIVQEFSPQLRERIFRLSGFPSRADYEAALATSDLWVSTAEHEFFGVAAVEAALLGATPLLPRSLAYAETLPSAPTYEPGNSGALAGAIQRLARRSFNAVAPWQLDAERFLAPEAVERFDRIVEGLAGWR